MEKLGHNSTGGRMFGSLHNGKEIVINEERYSDGPPTYDVFERKGRKLGKLLTERMSKKELFKMLRISRLERA